MSFSEIFRKLLETFQNFAEAFHILVVTNKKSSAFFIPLVTLMVT